MWREKVFIYEQTNPKHKIADVKNKKSENKFQSVSAKCLMIEVPRKFQYKLT